MTLHPAPPRWLAVGQSAEAWTCAEKRVAPLILGLVPGALWTSAGLSLVLATSSWGPPVVFRYPNRLLSLNFLTWGVL